MSYTEPRLPSSGEILAFEHVEFGYGRVPLLHDVSLTVNAGQLVSVVGPNGAGKTTLVRLALGLLRPLSGEVRLFGTPLAEVRAWGDVGYVPQRAASSMSLPVSVEEAVVTGLAGRLGLLRRPSAAERAHVDHVLELLGLDDLRAAPYQRLSGGQQQRTLIARALASTPRLLLLDEPTTGVDAAARTILRQTLRHLVDVEGVTVFSVSHDPDAVGSLTDVVVEVSGGHAHVRPGPRAEAATPKPAP